MRATILVLTLLGCSGVRVGQGPERAGRPPSPQEQARPPEHDEHGADPAGDTPTVPVVEGDVDP